MARTWEVNYWIIQWIINWLINYKHLLKKYNKNINVFIYFLFKFVVFYIFFTNEVEMAIVTFQEAVHDFLGCLIISKIHYNWSNIINEILLQSLFCVNLTFEFKFANHTPDAVWDEHLFFPQPPGAAERLDIFKENVFNDLREVLCGEKWKLRKNIKNVVLKCWILFLLIFWDNFFPTCASWFILWSSISILRRACILKKKTIKQLSQ